MRIVWGVNVANKVPAKELGAAAAEVGGIRARELLRRTAIKLRFSEDVLDPLPRPEARARVIFCLIGSSAKVIKRQNK